MLRHALYTKKYKFTVKFPFSTLYRHSTENFNFEDFNKWHKIIEKIDERDAKRFRELWIGGENPSIRCISPRNENSLPLNLRVSLHNVLDLMRSKPSNSLTRSMTLATLEPLKSKTSVITRSLVRNYGISSALTFIDRLLFQAAKPADLYRPEDSALKQRILKQEKGLIKWIKRTVRSANQKTRILSLLIQICKHLKKQRNYHSLFLIVRSLDSLQKELNEEWHRLSDRRKNFFKDIESIYDPAFSFRNYRCYLDEEPLIPAMTIIYRDIYLLFQHNQLWLSIGEINEKMTSIFAKNFGYLSQSQSIEYLGRVDMNVVSELSFY
jgi:hypothetical protein